MFVFAEVTQTLTSGGATDLKWTAIATGWVPVVGCVTNGLADTEEGRNQVIVGLDATICGGADVLMFIPLGQIPALVIHGIRSLVRLFDPSVKQQRTGPPNIDELLGDYGDNWSNYVSRVREGLESKGYMQNLTAQLDAGTELAVFYASKAAGTLHGVQVYAAEANATADTDTAELEFEESDDDLEFEESDDDLDFENGDDDLDFENSDDDAGQPVGTNGTAVVASKEGDESELGNNIFLGASEIQFHICLSRWESKKRIEEDTRKAMEENLSAEYAKYYDQFIHQLRRSINEYYTQMEQLSRNAGYWGPSTVEKDTDTYINELENRYKQRYSQTPYPRAQDINGAILEILQKTANYRNLPKSTVFHGII